MINTLTHKLADTFPFSKMFNNILIPDCLETVTDIGSEADPACVGIEPRHVESVWRAVERFYGSAANPAVTISVRYKGEHVLNRAIGHARGAESEADAVNIRTDTPICLFSASKAVTALLVHKLAELNLLELDKPLCEYIPEFSAGGKDTVTVDDLLRHKAGVPKLNLHSPYELSDHDSIIEQLCRANMRPLFGKMQGYHAVTGGHLIAELVQRVTGDPIEVLHDRYFRKPLNMEYFTYGLDPQHEDKVAHNVRAGMISFFPVKQHFNSIIGFDWEEVVEKSNEPEFTRATIPAANMYATASECSRFYEMLVNGGSYQGVQVLKPETIARAKRAPRYAPIDTVGFLPFRFSSGFMMGGAPLNLYGPDAKKSFGHLGFLNNLTWADPQRDLSAAILTNGKQILGPHLIQLNLLLAEISRQFPKVTRKRLSSASRFMR